MEKIIALLQDSARGLSDILNQVSDAIIFTDTNYRIRGWNKASEKIYKWKRREVLEKSFLTLLPASNGFTSKQTIVDALEKKGNWKGEITQTRRDGVEITVLSSISVVKNKIGNSIGYIAINRDITERKKAENLVRFKGEASRVLSSSLDYKKTLNNVASIVVSKIADWCAVDIIVDTKIISLAFAHKNPQKALYAQKIQKKYPTKLLSHDGIAYVIKTGKPIFYPTVSNQLLDKLTETREHQKFLKNLGFSSVIIVPLIIQGDIIGGIILANGANSRHFDKTDFEMAKQLATRAALAIENVELYELVKKERERLVQLLSDVPGVVWEAWGRPDEDRQKINFVSKYVEKMLGYTVDEWLSTPNFWLSIVHPDDRKRASLEALLKFEGKKPAASRFRWIRKDGKVLWVESQSKPIYDNNHNPVGMRGVTMDITERMELENKKDEFITAASHELKTPLTTQKAFVQLLLKKAAKEENQAYYSYLQKVSQQTDRLTRLINDLLDVSKIHAGKLALHKQSFEVSACVEEAIEDIQQTTSSHTIQLKSTVKSEIFADRERINQVLTNLLSNAIKYSPKSQTVIVNMRETKKFVIISVTDFGIGISVKNKKYIFDRFFREDNNNESNFPGLGMGLYISQQIARSHNGIIVVESQKGKGSTFQLHLPKK